MFLVQLIRWQFESWSEEEPIGVEGGDIEFGSIKSLHGGMNEPSVR